MGSDDAQATSASGPGSHREKVKNELVGEKNSQLSAHALEASAPGILPHRDRNMDAHYPAAVAADELEELSEEECALEAHAAKVDGREVSRKKATTSRLTWVSRRFCPAGR